MVLLLSGFSRRLGSDKLLLPFGENFLVEYTLDLVFKIHFHQVLVVYRNQKIKELAEDRGFSCVFNNDAHEGINASIRYGIRALDRQSEGCLFLSGDRPFLKKSHIEGLIQAFTHHKDKIIVPCFQGKHSSPCLFPRKFYKELESLKPGEQGKSIVFKNKESCVFVNFDDAFADFDIDTSEDVLKFQNFLKNKFF